MDYRILENPEDLERAVEVEIAVWQQEPRDAVPASMLRAIGHAGGVVYGAFDGEKLVGTTFAFPALRDGRLILWSHVAGVLPEYQGRDIGFTLKLRQREWALSHGYDEIGWTFDPARRGNASFNLHRLGAVSSTYLVNFYGTMQDSLNAGRPTDRLEARWMLNSARVLATAEGRYQHPVYTPPDAASTLTAHSDWSRLQAASDHDVFYVALPTPSDSEPSAAAVYASLRGTLAPAFQAGLTAVGVHTVEGRTWYVLVRCAT